MRQPSLSSFIQKGRASSWIFLALVATALFMGALPAHAGPAPRPADPLPKQELVVELKTWADESAGDPHLEALEKDLRQEFIYRLRFQVERRYDGSDASLMRILNFMKELEESPQNRSLSQVNDFLTELLRCIDMNREPAEGLFSFVKTYAKISGLHHPLKAEQYAMSRAYLNAAESRGAKVLSENDWVQIGNIYDEANADDEEEAADVSAAEPASAAAVSPTAVSPSPVLSTTEEPSYDLETPSNLGPQAPAQILNP